MTAAQRLELSQDQLQRYHRHLLNHEELKVYGMHKFRVDIISLLGTIAIPWTLVNMLTLRDNPAVQKTRLVHSTGLLSLVFVGFMYFGKQQSEF